MENLMKEWPESCMDASCLSEKIPYVEETVKELRNRGYRFGTTACKSGENRNLVALRTWNYKALSQAICIGDSIKDAREAKNAGMPFVGIIEGSSLMEMSQDEYNTLTEMEKEAVRARIANAYKGAGADYVIRDIRWLLELLH